jgi:hypothetical protein
MLAAAENRAQSQAKRGVREGGGDLAKKLEEQKRRSTSPLHELPGNSGGPGLQWKAEQ